jgi:hypothetical protein
MTSKTPDPEKSNSNVTIGDVQGGIHDSTIAGRDVIKQIKNFFIGGRDEQREQRNRRIMLERVRQFWVEGVLEKSLHKEILIQLGKQEQPDAVLHPWDMQLQEAADHEPKPIPKDKPVIEIFEEMGRSMLILGAPGSGKTITLLELARDAIVCAEADPLLPIPVVFNLSSWAERKQTLGDWLIGELNLKYQIPKKVAQEWLEHEELFLLLDGLDEVKKESRNTCVEAINQFRQEHGLTDIIVCSRIEEYNALANKLNLQGAILLQSLTIEQIDDYLVIAGSALAALRTIMQEDAAFQELAESPLMLSIMILVYQGLLVEDIRNSGTPEEHRKRLFALYIEYMLKRRDVESKYTNRQTIYWLSNLAHRLLQHNQSVFMIEYMQPSWLLSRLQKWLYYVGIILLVGMPTGLFVGLSGWSSVKFGTTPFISRVFGYGLGITFGLIVCLFTKQSFGLISKLLVSLAFGLTFGIPFKMQFNTSIGLLVGIAIGIVAGIVFSLIGKLLESKVKSNWNNIEIVEILRWSWLKVALGLFIGLTGGAVFGGIIGYGAWKVAVLNFVIAFGLSAGLVGGLVSGLSSDKLETRTRFNQGIWRSYKNACRIGIIITLLTGLPIGIGNGMAWNTFFTYSRWGKECLIIGVSSGMTIGIAFGLTFGLFFGGLAFIQHFILRFILYKSGCIPYNLVRFLDYAVDRILLRKVGGGYIFIHRLLLEYFAALEHE